MHVALVGSGAVQRERSEETAAGLFEDDAHRDGAESEAAVFTRKLRTVDSCFARLLTESIDVRRFLFRGDDFVAHECGDAIAQLDELGRKVKVHVSFGDSRKSSRLPARRPRTS